MSPFLGMDMWIDWGKSSIKQICFHAAVVKLLSSLLIKNCSSSTVCILFQVGIRENNCCCWCYLIKYDSYLSPELIWLKSSGLLLKCLPSNRVEKHRFQSHYIWNSNFCLHWPWVNLGLQRDLSIVVVFFFSSTGNMEKLDQNCSLCKLNPLSQSPWLCNSISHSIWILFWRIGLPQAKWSSTQLGLQVPKFPAKLVWDVGHWDPNTSRRYQIMKSCCRHSLLLILSGSELHPDGSMKPHSFIDKRLLCYLNFTRYKLSIDDTL